jgi:hypothetical protein
MVFARAIGRAHDAYGRTHTGDFNPFRMTGAAWNKNAVQGNSGFVQNSNAIPLYIIMAAYVRTLLR